MAGKHTNKDITQADQLARYLQELSRKGFVSFPNARGGANGEIVVLSQERVRLDPEADEPARPGDVLSIAELRYDEHDDLTRLRQHMVDLGYVKPENAKRIFYMNLGEEEDWHQYATMQGRGGSHNQAMLVVPTEALDAEAITHAVKTLRFLEERDRAEQAVHVNNPISLAASLGKSEDGVEAMARVLASSDPESFAKAYAIMQQALLKDANKRFAVTAELQEQGIAASSGSKTWAVSSTNRETPGKETGTDRTPG